MSIRTWEDAYHQLWKQAAHHHGLRETAGELPDPITVRQWPRTRGADVLAIAAVVDPELRAAPLLSGGYAVERQWHDCICDMAAALRDPAGEYRHNRSFWSSLASAVVYLASIDAPVPELWRAVLAEIAEEQVYRPSPVVDHKLHLAATDYDELWQAQKAALAKLRGADVRELPLGMLGGPMAIPRTTHADILQLAAYWTDALNQIEAKRHTIGAAGHELGSAVGLDGEERRWRAALADVRNHAKTGVPGQVYPKNHEFWRASASLSVTLAVIDAEPAPFELHLDTANGRPHADDRSIRNADQPVTHAIDEGTFMQVWDKKHAELAKARGSDALDPPPGWGGGRMDVPRSTNADILQLAPYWDNAWKHLEDRRPRLGNLWISNLPTEQGLDAEKERWEAAMKDVNAIAKAGKPGDVYPKNHEFWRATRSLSTTLDIFHEVPTKGQIALDVAEEIPERIGHVVEEVAQAVGGLAKKAGEGLLSGLGTPLLIGGGVVLALVLLLRRGDRTEHAEAA